VEPVTCRTSRSRAPPPTETSTAWQLSARARISARAAEIRARAAAGSATSRSSIWADHHRRVGRGREPATFAHHAGRVGGCGHDRRLLHGHGNQIVALVDLEIERHAQGQGVDTHDILNHAGRVCRSDAAGVEQGQVIIGQLCTRRQLAAPILPATGCETLECVSRFGLSDIEGSPRFDQRLLCGATGNARAGQRDIQYRKRRLGRAHEQRRGLGRGNRASPTSPPPAPDGLASATQLTGQGSRLLEGVGHGSSHPRLCPVSAICRP